MTGIESLTPSQRRIFELLRDPAVSAKDVTARTGWTRRAWHNEAGHVYNKLGIEGGNGHRRNLLIARYGAPADLARKVEELERRVSAIEEKRRRE